jgi:ribosomal protein S18 acetylase RimI-like enzyme
MTGTLSLRAVEPADRRFLFEVYARTRDEELARVDWDASQRDAFLLHQFTVQDRFYREHYDGAEFSVVLLDGEPIGRLYVARRPDEIRVIDLALLPAQRGAGVGTRLLEALLGEAARSQRRLSVHVEKLNRARSLYERLGFRAVDDSGVYTLMEAYPNTAS